MNHPFWDCSTHIDGERPMHNVSGENSASFTPVWRKKLYDEEGTANRKGRVCDQLRGDAEVLRHIIDANNEYIRRKPPDYLKQQYDIFHQDFKVSQQEYETMKGKESCWAREKLRFESMCHGIEEGERQELQNLKQDVKSIKAMSCAMCYALANFHKPKQYDRKETSGIGIRDKLPDKTSAKQESFSSLIEELDEVSMQDFGCNPNGATPQSLLNALKERIEEQREPSQSARDLALEKHEQKRAISNGKATLLEASTALKRFRNTVEESNNKNILLSHKISIGEKVIAQLQDKVKTLTGERNSKDKTIKFNLQQRARSFIENKSLRNAITQLEEKLRQHQLKIERLVQTAEEKSIESENQTLRSELDIAKSQTTVRNQDEAITRLVGKVKLLAHEIEDLTDQLHGSRKHLCVNEENLRIKDEQLSVKDQNLLTTNEKLKVSTDNLSTSNAKLRTCDEDLVKVKADSFMYLTQLQQRNSDKEKLETVINQQNQKIKSFEIEINECRNEIAKLTTNIEQLMVEVDSSNKKIKSSGEKISQVQKISVTHFQDSQQSYNEQVRKITLVTKESSHMLKMQTEQCEMLKKELVNKSASLLYTEEELRNFKMKLHHRIKKAEQMDLKIKEAHVFIQNLTVDKTALVQLATENEELKTKLKSVESDKGRKESLLNLKLESEILELQHRLAELSTSKECLAEMKQNKEKEKEALLKDLEKRKQDLEISRSDVLQIRQQYEYVKEQLKQSEHSMIQFKKETKNSATMIDKLGRKLDDQKNLLQDEERKNMLRQANLNLKISLLQTELKNACKEKEKAAEVSQSNSRSYISGLKDVSTFEKKDGSYDKENDGEQNSNCAFRNKLFIYMNRPKPVSAPKLPNKRELYSSELDNNQESAFVSNTNESDVSANICKRDCGGNYNNGLANGDSKESLPGRGNKMVQIDENTFMSMEDLELAPLPPLNFIENTEYDGILKQLESSIQESTTTDSQSDDLSEEIQVDDRNSVENNACETSQEEDDEEYKIISEEVEYGYAKDYGRYSSTSTLPMSEYTNNSDSSIILQSSATVNTSYSRTYRVSSGYLANISKTGDITISNVNSNESVLKEEVINDSITGNYLNSENVQEDKEHDEASLSDVLSRDSWSDSDSDTDSDNPSIEVMSAKVVTRYNRSKANDLDVEENVDQYTVKNQDRDPVNIYSNEEGCDSDKATEANSASLQVHGTVVDKCIKGDNECMGAVSLSHQDMTVSTMNLSVKYEMDNVHTDEENNIHSSRKTSDAKMNDGFEENEDDRDGHAFIKTNGSNTDDQISETPIETTHPMEAAESTRVDATKQDDVFEYSNRIELYRQQLSNIKIKDSRMSQDTDTICKANSNMTVMSQGIYKNSNTTKMTKDSSDTEKTLDDGHERSGKSDNVLDKEVVAEKISSNVNLKQIDDLTSDCEISDERDLEDECSNENKSGRQQMPNTQSKESRMTQDNYDAISEDNGSSVTSQEISTNSNTTKIMTDNGDRHDILDDDLDRSGKTDNILSKEAVIQRNPIDNDLRESDDLINECKISDESDSEDDNIDVDDILKGLASFDSHEAKSSKSLPLTRSVYRKDSNFNVRSLPIFDENYRKEKAGCIPIRELMSMATIFTEESDIEEHETNVENETCLEGSFQVLANEKDEVTIHYNSGNERNNDSRNSENCQLTRNSSGAGKSNTTNSNTPYDVNGNNLKNDDDDVEDDIDDNNSDIDFESDIDDLLDDGDENRSSASMVQSTVNSLQALKKSLSSNCSKFLGQSPKDASKQL